MKFRTLFASTGIFIAILFLGGGYLFVRLILEVIDWLARH